MQQATGELNMTVVTVVAIAAVAAFFYAFVWPNIKTSIVSSTNCATATCPSSSCTSSGSSTKCTGCYDPNDESKGTFNCTFQNGNE